MEAKGRNYQPNENRTSYIDGNTVRKLNSVPQRQRTEQQQPVRRTQEQQPAKRRQEQPKTLSGIDFASLLVLSLAIIITVYACVEYLKAQTELSKMEKDIVSLEASLIVMSHENDALYEQINTAYDMAYVYDKAVNELGMVYPNHNTVITYEKTENNYTRQYKDVPEVTDDNPLDALLHD
ncbi:MAG: putative rane protein [Herbinix sp.]|jgi:cell division protein FtsL|nr:putative rane protein [Herbinix sp.]